MLWINLRCAMKASLCHAVLPFPWRFSLRKRGKLSETVREAASSGIAAF
jgi:hypothetical protein